MISLVGYFNISKHLSLPPKRPISNGHLNSPPCKQQRSSDPKPFQKSQIKPKLKY